MEQVGVLNGMITVYVDPSLDDDKVVIMNYKAVQSEFDAGAFYVPYVPLTYSGVVTVPSPPVIEEVGIEHLSDDAAARFIFILRFGTSDGREFTPEIQDAFDWVLSNTKPEQRSITHHYTASDACDGVMIEFYDIAKAALFKLLHL